MYHAGADSKLLEGVVRSFYCDEPSITSLDAEMVLLVERAGGPSHYLAKENSPKDAGPGNSQQW